MPKKEEIMDTVGQTISERERGEIIYDNGLNVRIWAASSERGNERVM